MAKKRTFIYPVDTDQFERIREDGKVYVDKTGMIYDIVNVQKFQYVFLARPRRFGKSLLCNTFKAYFLGKKEMFEGLKIAEKEKEWKTYPVLHFTMSGLKNVTVPEAKGKLEAMLRDYEAVYGRDPLTETPGGHFRDLIHRAQAQTGEKVVVLIDEYDAPIMRLMYEKEKLVQMRDMLREFYQVLKDEGAYLRFVFLTGVTRFSQLSIFSELNNLKQISMMDEYSGICGITQEELNEQLRPCVEEYAENLELTVDEAYALLKRNYDGYHFSPHSHDVYAPFSLLQALNDNSTNSYWLGSATPTALLEHLQHFPTFNPLDYDGVEAAVDDFDVPCENADTPIPLLYQSGYLSINTYDRDMELYTLHFPNYEVRQGMVKGLSKYLTATDDMERNSAVVQMARALKESDLGKALTAMRSYIATMPYDIITKKEWMQKKSSEAFYKLLMYIIFNMLDSKVDTEVKSVLGRADVVIRTKTHIYVLELKVDGMVDVALEQIDSIGYSIPYEADGRQVVKCGIRFSSRARNIMHWRAIDENGNVVTEQNFTRKKKSAGKP